MGQTDAVTEPAKARVGRTLNGTWRLDRLLGVGGIAAVYEATDPNGKRVAIKMLHPDLSRDTTQRKRFKREAHAANAIDHPGVVKVDSDDVDEDGSAFLVMELLSGKSLDALVNAEHRQMPPEDVVRLIDQLLGVLEAAHNKNIVHGDLKPENLFATSDGVLKVLDFGMARLREAGITTSVETTAGTLGTPAYLAPEQARGRWELVDNRTDLWAVGAIMFTLLSGEHVHQADTVSEQLDMAMTAAPRSLASVTAELPQSLIIVVDKALQYQRADRYQDATEMRNALRRVMRELSVAPVASARASRPSSQSLSDGLTVAASASNPDIRANDADTVPKAPTAHTPPRSQPPIKRRKQLILGGAAVGAIVAAVIVATSRSTPSSSSASGATDEPAAPNSVSAPAIPAQSIPAAPSVVATATPEVSAVVSASPSASALRSVVPSARRAPPSGHAKPTAPSGVDPLDGRR